MGSSGKQFFNVEVSSKLFFCKLLKETLDHLNSSGIILIIFRDFVILKGVTVWSDWNVEFICFIYCLISFFRCIFVVEKFDCDPWVD